MCWQAHCLSVPKWIVVSAVSVCWPCYAVWLASSFAPSLICFTVSDMLSVIWTTKTDCYSVAPSWIIDCMSRGKCLLFMCRLGMRLFNAKVVSALICLTLSAFVVYP
ncbi:TPA: hypothetical protein ACH3X2_003208 [Trebouxia sp. C0005]